MRYVTCILACLVETHLSTELVDGLWWEPPAPEGSESEESGVVPVTDYLMLYELLYLPLRDHSVEEVHTAILPLHRTVDVQGIAQPIVGGTSGREGGGGGSGGREGGREGGGGEGGREGGGGGREGGREEGGGREGGREGGRDEGCQD